MQWPARIAAGLAIAFATAIASGLRAIAATAVSVMDDAGHRIALPTQAHRIISLAPHATELLFAAGAGSYLVGVSEYSDYPPQAQQIVSIGSAHALDLERVIALQPDLVVAWGSGNKALQVDRLKALGIPVFDSEPHDFETIATSLERLAHLAGTDTAGNAAAAAFRNRLQMLTDTYRQRSPVSVFYQIWRAPLMTLNGKHMVSAAIRLCGGNNIFDALPQLASAVNLEDVIKSNPEAIVGGNNPKEDIFAIWRRFPQLAAVSHNNLFSIESGWMTRPSPRILDGTAMLCRQLDAARARRK